MKHILFIHGGGDSGFKTDKQLAGSLEKHLGKEYKVHYPEMISDDSAPDFGWVSHIKKYLSAIRDEVILCGHSLGASMILKFLSENDISQNISGVFLIATPFWSGDEDWKKGLKLRDDFTETLPENTPLFFYHSRDDEEVPFSHFLIYKRKLPKAHFRETETGGHQLNNDADIVTKDIQAL